MRYFFVRILVEKGNLLARLDFYGILIAGFVLALKLRRHQNE
jgi:hypothetical protein